MCVLMSFKVSIHQERERERGSKSKRAILKKKDGESVCGCVCAIFPCLFPPFKRDRENESVCVCVKERERERGKV